MLQLPSAKDKAEHVLDDILGPARLITMYLEKLLARVEFELSHYPSLRSF
jgi:hypothetical protein